MGRFVNLDAFVSTGVSFGGFNMFAYCNNNAVNAIDSTGTDAIILQYHDAAKYMGHTSLLIQDASYCWWYFYWGSSKGFWETLTGSVDAFMIYTPIGYLHYGYDLSNLDDVIAALKERENGNPTEISYHKGLTGVKYFEGDFTNSHYYILSLISKKQERKRTVFG